MKSDEDFIQLIFCVETNENAMTDRYYIRSVLREYYNIGNNRISFVYMDGKYKYKQTKVLKKITTLKKEFSVTNNENSYVIYCCDKDKNMSVPEDASFVKELEKYCKDNSFELIWFVKTIEDVFWRKVVCDKDKIRGAKRFITQNKIQSVNLSQLKATANVNARHMSNIITVLNKFPQIKK